MSRVLGAVTAVELSGDEPFTLSGAATEMSVGAFWRWSASDLLGNAMRGLVAEFLVAHALGSVSTPRREWDAYDVLTEDGIKVEVKSSAHLQSWSQTRPSVLTFSVNKTYGWDATTNTTASVRGRQADVYVFCVLAHKDKGTVDPLNLDQWQFYVLATSTLNQELGEQRTAALSTLQRAGAQRVDYAVLPEAVRRHAHASD